MTPTGAGSITAARPPAARGCSLEHDCNRPQDAARRGTSGPYTRRFAVAQSSVCLSSSAPHRHC
eukprot:3304255-Pyramimonas_sp.AAC.1